MKAKASTFPISLIALVCLSVAFFPSCTFLKLVGSTSLKKPTFDYVSYNLQDVSVSRAKVKFLLSSFNPNPIGLKNVKVSYELFTHDKRFLRGNDIEVNLKPKDTTEIVVPAEVVYEEVFAAIGPVAQGLLLEKKSIPVRIDAVIDGNPTVYNGVEQGGLFSFTVKLSRTVDIPIPEEKIKSLMRSSLKKMF